MRAANGDMIVFLTPVYANHACSLYPYSLGPKVDNSCNPFKRRVVEYLPTLVELDIPRHLISPWITNARSNFSMPATKAASIGTIIIPYIAGPSRRTRYKKGDVVYVASQVFAVDPVGFIKATVIEDEDVDTVKLDFCTSHDMDTLWWPPIAKENVKVQKDCLYLANWRDLHKRCRKAVLTWLCCIVRYRFGKDNRLWVCKDLRKLIAKQVWASRDGSDWEHWKFTL
jgi:hypothetical protein